MEKIALTELGEYLLEHPDFPATDESELSHRCIGLHETCRGWIYHNPISATHQAIWCASCKLRIVMPREIETYGQLRQYLAEKLAQSK